MTHRIDILSIELHTCSATQDARVLHDTFIDSLLLPVFSVIYRTFERILKRQQCRQTI